MNYPKNKVVSNYHKILLILMILSTLILGSIILLKSKANFTITNSGFTTSVGGPGGSETGLQSCPVGTVAIGMEGKAVTQVDAVREGFGYLSDYATRCGTYSIDPSTKLISTTYDSTTSTASGVIVASRTPIPKALDCPSGSVLGGYTGFQKFNSSQNTTLVVALKPRCSALTIDPATNLIVVAEKTDYGPDYVVTAPPAGSDPIAKADCATNSVVTGFEGRVGELFDLFKLACGTINQSSLSISIVSLDYADYKVVATDANGAITEIMHKTPVILAPGTYDLSLVNTKNGDDFGNFVCDTSIVTSTIPYVIKLPNNTTNFCTINPDEMLQNVGLEPKPIDTVLAPAITPVTVAVDNKTVEPIVITTAAPIQVTTRTGGIYISIISLLMLSLVGILVFLKMKRKN